MCTLDLFDPLMLRKNCDDKKIAHDCLARGVLRFVARENFDFLGGFL